ncbi:MAG: type II/IV secretion system ATPase subunit [archaeon]|nr:type II/IV secretion system ATPase subunit [archaeon]
MRFSRKRDYDFCGNPGEPTESLPQFMQGGNNMPPQAPLVQRSPFMEELRTIMNSNTRTKPTYSDCWLVGSAKDLDILEEYDSPSGHVVIGTARDGEIEYNLTPTEYRCSDAINSIIVDLIEKVREDYRKNGGRGDRFYIDSKTNDLLAGYSDRISVSCGGNAQAVEDLNRRICDIVYRYTVGLGVFDILLSDPRLEDIYIDAPCDKNRIHVTLSGIAGSNAHDRCRTNLIVEKREVQNLICHLKRLSGLPFTESNPVLETDMKLQDARATVIGYPLSPNGDAVAIRKHSSCPWTLTRLIANGTLDPYTAGLLSFLVQNRAAFLVCGARGAGKSSLLSALMFEFPVSQRILTIEDTLELPGEAMRKMGYKIQSMLIDERLTGTNLSRSNDALRVSLRMGESAIILGEVRGEEAKTLYESMRTGRAGSSIMGTIHGDSAKSVYDRVVHDMGISPEAFMATDIIVTMGTVRDRVTGSQIRKVNELVATSSRVGVFSDMSSAVNFKSPVMKRALASCGLTESEALEEIKARGEIRKLLAEKGKEDERYLQPEWVNVANEYVSRNTGKTSENLVNGFITKLGNE